MLKFELSEQMVAAIGKALGAQPYDLVHPIIAELQRQITAQQASANKATNGSTRPTDEVAARVS